MAYVVAEPCYRCRYNFCVLVCPVACFHKGEDFVVIDPDECTHCGECALECPKDAIYAEPDLPSKWGEYAVLNSLLSRIWPSFSVEQARSELARLNAIDSGDEVDVECR